MSPLQRHLINLEMIADDISMLDESELLSDEHLQLLKRYKSELTRLNELASSETESAFKSLIQKSVLSTLVDSRQMLLIHLKLIEYIQTFTTADAKIQSILTTRFDSNSDKYLELLQTKAIRAKSQLKTVAMAMGKVDYEKFTQFLSLNQDEWLWDVLKARY